MLRRKKRIGRKWAVIVALATVPLFLFACADGGSSEKAVGGQSSSSGGSANVGGSNSDTGGTTTSAGGASTGGASTAGTSAGGASTGGASAGGTSTGGASTGGASTGGTSTGGASTGGASTGGSNGTGGSAGSGATFPPLTSFTAQNGGFGSVTQRNVNGVALFRPLDANFGQNGLKHPIVVWGNGSTNTVDIWANFLSRVASYGFIVVAPEQTQVTAAQMRAAIDYVIQLSSDTTSIYYGKVDTTKIAATGYSLGGLGALDVGQDARIGTTFVLCAVAQNRQQHGHLGGVFAENDQYFSLDSMRQMINASNQPAFGAVFGGGTHVTTPGQPKSSEAYIAWLRWHFMGDPAAKALFVGPTCQICTDSAFSEVVKNGIDAL